MDFMTAIVALSSDPLSGLPPHTIDVDVAHKIFHKVDAYHSGFLDAGGFADALVLAVAYGYMTPFPGTPSVADRAMPSGTKNSMLRKLRLESLDFFDDAHADLSESGEPVRVLKTRHGGVFTVIIVVPADDKKCTTFVGTRHVHDCSNLTSRV